MCVQKLHFSLFSYPLFDKNRLNEWQCVIYQTKFPSLATICKRSHVKKMNGAPVGPFRIRIDLNKNPVYDTLAASPALRCIELFYLIVVGLVCIMNIHFLNDTLDLTITALCYAWILGVIFSLHTGISPTNRHKFENRVFGVSLFSQWPRSVPEQSNHKHQFKNAI